MNHLSIRRPLAVLVLALPLLAATQAQAHDLVLVPETSGDLTVKFGHPNDWQPADRERLLDLQVEGEPAPRLLASGLKAAGKNLSARQVMTKGHATLVSGRYDNGLWVAMPGTAGKSLYFNTTKAMLPDGGSTMAAIKFAKALYATPDDQTVYRQQVRHLIELVPQSNPAAVKTGGKLKVLVLLNGKALADAGVEVTDASTTSGEGQPSWKTDAAGIAEVPIRRAGLNVLSVDHDVPNDGAVVPAMMVLPVDKVAMIATYAFQVH